MSSASEPPRETAQPLLLTGGVLRRYQLDGLHWLKVCSLSVVFSFIYCHFTLASLIVY